MKLGKHISYCKSIEPSIGVFYWVDHNGAYNPLEIHTRKAMGQKNGHSDAYDEKHQVKANATKQALSAGNIHTIEYCYTPINAEFIACLFSVRFEANSLTPERFWENDDTYNTLKEFISLYQKYGGYKYLAAKYLKSIYSGKWLWRNQGKDKTQILIRSSSGHELFVDNADTRFYSDNWHDLHQQFDDVIRMIAKAFTDPATYYKLNVEAKLFFSPGMPVYPSQLFIDKGTTNGKVLDSTIVNGVRTAVFNSDKLGAAIATIDDWYPNADYPVRVGSYGVDKKRNSCYRHPETGKDIYSLLSGLECVIDKLTQAQSTEDIPTNAHFIAANLIKGGLFQGGKDQ